MSDYEVKSVKSIGENLVVVLSPTPCAGAAAPALGFILAWVLIWLLDLPPVGFTGFLWTWAISTVISFVWGIQVSLALVALAVYSGVVHWIL